jgi:hypothetical protein
MCYFRGLAIHTFHGNFFVRSTDLLSLPNVNPDAGFGMQLSIEESLSDVQNVCFQAALLYTSSKGMKLLNFPVKKKRPLQNAHISIRFSFILASFKFLKWLHIENFQRSGRAHFNIVTFDYL